MAANDLEQLARLQRLIIVSQRAMEQSYILISEARQQMKQATECEAKVWRPPSARKAAAG